MNAMLYHSPSKFRSSETITILEASSGTKFVRQRTADVHTNRQRTRCTINSITIPSTKINHRFQIPNPTQKIIKSQKQQRRIPIHQSGSPQRFPEDKKKKQTIRQEARRYGTAPRITKSTEEYPKSQQQIFHEKKPVDRI